MSVILNTGYKLPQAVISNGETTGNEWANPNNILLVDGDVAESNQGAGTASDIIVGNFNFNIPEGSVITGIMLKVIGYEGQQTSPTLTLSPVAVDNTSGENEYYPYQPPYEDLTTSLATHILGTSTYLFATSWTVNQINNFKLQLIANGPISLDCVLVNVYYYEVQGGEPTPVEDGLCVSCESPIQAQPFSLALPVTGTDTGIYLKSFNTPRGIPITMDDVGECGGSIYIVMDQGKPYGNGNAWEETARVIDIVEQPNGTVFLDFGSLDNRGLGFVQPYLSDADNISAHNANSEVVISNAAVYENQKLRQCQIGVLVSAPITVSDEDAPVVTAVEDIDFRGAGVIVTQDPSDSRKAIVTISGAGGTTPPVVVSSSDASTGDVQADTLAWDHTSLGINRGLLVQISTEQTKTVTGVTFNGIALTQVESNTDATNNIRQEQWFLVAPPAGTYEIEITMSAAAYITAGAESYVGVDQTTPTGTTAVDSGDSNNPNVELITAYDNSIVVDGLATALTPILYTKGENQTENWHITANGNTRQGASSYQMAGSAPDTINMEWDLTQTTDWVITAVEIKGITSEAGGGGGAVDLEVNQVAHGFSVGQLLRSSGTDDSYALALADTGANADVVGIVKEVIDANNFVMTKDAYFDSTSVPVGTPGSAVFLSAVTPGLMVLTAPVTPGHIEKPVGIIMASGQLMSFSIDIRGSVIGSGGGGTGIVETVTGLDTDNTDPANPIVQISVDGVTITGAGTPGSPLVATGGSGAPGDLVIQNLLAGEPIAGATTPAAVFEGTNTILTTLQTGVQNAITFHFGSYDFVGRISYEGSQIQLNPNRRATNFTTPSHTVTVNQLIFSCEANSNGTQSGDTFTASIYTDSGGAPNTLLLQRTATDVPLINNEFTLNVPFPDNETLSANTTYWLVLEWDKADDPGNFSNLYLDVANVGTGLFWNGSAWVASDPFIFCLVLSPYKGYVYKSFETSASLDEREAFLGITNQTVSAGAAVDVVRDGVLVGFTGLTVAVPYYMSASTPGVLATSGSNKIAFATKATEIVISRNTGIYQ